jgi:hypothetical protein
VTELGSGENDMRNFIARSLCFIFIRIILKNIKTISPSGRTGNRCTVLLEEIHGKILLLKIIA